MVGVWLGLDDFEGHFFSNLGDSVRVVVVCWGSVGKSGARFFP